MRVVPGPLPTPDRRRPQHHRYISSGDGRPHARLQSDLARNARSSPSAARWPLSSGFPEDLISRRSDFRRTSTRSPSIRSPSATITDIPAGYIQMRPIPSRNTSPATSGRCAAALSNSRGAHNLKYGIDYRILDFNEGQNTAPSGNYTFTRAYTQGPIANVPPRPAATVSPTSSSARQPAGPSASSIRSRPRACTPLFISRMTGACPRN